MGWWIRASLLHVCLMQPVSFRTRHILVPAALRATRPRTSPLVAASYMSDIPSFCLSHSTGAERRQLHLFTNLTRRDGEEFLALAPEKVRSVGNCIHIPSSRQMKQLDNFAHGRFTGVVLVEIC